MRSRALWLVIAAAILSGCASWPGGAGSCRPALHPVAALGADQRLRAGVRITRDDEVAQLDLVVEKHGDELVLVARNELGTVAFVLVQRGTRVEIQRSLPSALLPVPPRALLADVQEALLSSQGPDSHPSSTRCGYTAQFSLRPETP